MDGDDNLTNKPRNTHAVHTEESAAVADLTSAPGRSQAYRSDCVTELAEASGMSFGSKIGSCWHWLKSTVFLRKPFQENLDLVFLALPALGKVGTAPCCHASHRQRHPTVYFGLGPQPKRACTYKTRGTNRSGRVTIRQCIIFRDGA